MVFHEDDVKRLFSRVPYLALAKPRSAKRYIASLVLDGVELQAVLSKFPEVRYEPLDQHYVLLRCLGALSDELVEDLCSLHYGWQGVVQAAFLVAIAPEERYRKYLVAARHKVPHTQWLVDLALAQINKLAWNGDTELQALVQRLRHLLSKVPARASSVLLRSALTEAELQQIGAEREKVRRAYRSGGLEAARKALSDTRVLRSRLARQSAQNGCRGGACLFRRSTWAAWAPASH